MKNILINECYKRSIDLLIRNSDRYGLSASSLNEKSEEREYDYIFARDASISAIGMIASGNKKLLSIAEKGMITLAKYQTKLGQIPYSVCPAKNEVRFYYLGSIDSTLWWLLSIYYYNKNNPNKKLSKKLKKNINLAVSWLFHQDQNNCGLLEQSEASDWADLMPNNGIVLYTNALWHKVLEAYQYKKEKELAGDGINNIFLPFEANINKSVYLKKEKTRIKHLKTLLKTTKEKPYYLNYVSHQYGNDRCDVYGNILAIIFGVAPQKKSKKIINYLIKNKISKTNPVITMFPPIEKKDFDWRPYLKHRNLNLPSQYHNGGAWPFVGAFWVIALAKSGNKKLAREELIKLAQTNKINNWEFNEWFHGKTGKPMGMPGQSWNAGAFLLAIHYLKGDFKL